jgi:hypothetical protein
MSDFRQDALKELARRELQSRSQPKPGLLERAANDVDTHINKPIEQFGRGVRDISEGFVQGIANTPPELYNLGAMGANALGAHLPKSPTFDLAPHNMNSTAGEIASMFAAPEAAFGAVSKGIGAGANALKKISNPKNLFATKNSIKDFMLNRHDMLEDKASKAFKQVSSEVNSRGINKLPVVKKATAGGDNPLSASFFNSMKQYMPNTRQSSELLKNASTGDYNAVRKLQSDLYTNAKKNLGSGLEADRLKGAEMMEKRNDINQAISNHLKKTGNHDLDKILSEARNDWSTLQKKYYNENMNNSLVNMFNKDFRKVPKNLVDILGEESIPMKELLEFHPGLEEKLVGNKLGAGIMNKGKKYGLPLALGALGGYEYGKH